MSWIYELLDARNTESTMLLGANVFIGLVFGFSATVGLFEYIWMFLPNSISTIQYFASKLLEPLVMF